MTDRGHETRQNPFKEHYRRFRTRSKNAANVPQDPKTPRTDPDPGSPHPSPKASSEGRQARIKLLRECTPPNRRLFDIVIVPDLTGVEKWEPSAESELAQANPNSSVFIYEYPSQRKHDATYKIATEIDGQAGSLQAANLEEARTQSTNTTSTLVESDDTGGEQRRTQAREDGDPVPVILVACGYGGLLCEVALMKELEVAPDESGFLSRVCRLILVATPHFIIGLQQWARFAAKHLVMLENRWVGGSRQRFDYMDIFEQQLKFRRRFTRPDSDDLDRDRRDAFNNIKSTDGIKTLEIACCFSSPTDLQTPPAIDRVWEILDFALLVGVEAGYLEMLDLFLLGPPATASKPNPPNAGEDAQDSRERNGEYVSGKDVQPGEGDRAKSGQVSVTRVTEDDMMNTGKHVAQRTKKFTAITDLIAELRLDGEGPDGGNGQGTVISNDMNVGQGFMKVGPTGLMPDTERSKRKKRGQTTVKILGEASSKEDGPQRRVNEERGDHTDDRRVGSSEGSQATNEERLESSKALDTGRGSTIEAASLDTSKALDISETQN